MIVGGGPAGLSAALVLGRARKRVLVVDNDRPANAVSQGVGGLLGHDRVKPAELRDSGQRQLEEYANVELRHGAVEDAQRTRDGFVVTPTDGPPVRAHAIVLAHGLRYDPPPLPGIEALWGRSVFHCAFCDGWEVRDRPLAFQGSGPGAARSALVLAGWSNDVVLCTDGAPDPGGEVLAAAGVRVRTEPITRLAGSDGRLTQIEFSHGPAERREALFVNTRRDQPNGLAAALGCELTDAGTIVTDADGRTNVAGVYAAGDAATAHSRSVANAIGTGSRVAYAVALERLRAGRRPGRPTAQADRRDALRAKAHPSEASLARAAGRRRLGPRLQTERRAELARRVRGPGWLGNRQPAAPLVAPVTVDVARVKPRVGVACEDVLDRVREAVPTQRAANLVAIDVGVPAAAGFPAIAASDRDADRCLAQVGIGAMPGAHGVCAVQEIVPSQPDGPVDAGPEPGRPRGEVEGARGAQVMRLGRRRRPGQRPACGERERGQK